MADPKLDELVFRASTAEPVDPVARIRERMLAGGIVKVAGGGGDGGPGPGQLQRAQAFKPGQGGVQVPAQALPPPGSPSTRNAQVSMLPARSIPGQGLLQPRSLAQIPGLLPKSPHPADSGKWALDLIARQVSGSNQTRLFPGPSPLIGVLVGTGAGILVAGGPQFQLVDPHPYKDDKVPADLPRVLPSPFGPPDDETWQAGSSVVRDSFVEYPVDGGLHKVWVRVGLRSDAAGKIDFEVTGAVEFWGRDYAALKWVRVTSLEALAGAESPGPLATEPFVDSERDKRFPNGDLAQRTIVGSAQLPARGAWVVLRAEAVDNHDHRAGGVASRFV